MKLYNKERTATGPIVNKDRPRPRLCPICGALLYMV